MVSASRRTIEGQALTRPQAVAFIVRQTRLTPLPWRLCCMGKVASVRLADHADGRWSGCKAAHRHATGNAFGTTKRGGLRPCVRAGALLDCPWDSSCQQTPFARWQTPGPDAIGVAGAIPAAARPPGALLRRWCSGPGRPLGFDRDPVLPAWLTGPAPGRTPAGHRHGTARSSARAGIRATAGGCCIQYRPALRHRCRPWPCCSS